MSLDQWFSNYAQPILGGLFEASQVQGREKGRRVAEDKT